MLLAAPKRVGLHVGQNVVHPTHIPLVVEAQTAHVSGMRNLGKRSGLLGYEQCRRAKFEHLTGKFAQKVDCLQIFLAAPHVGTPLPVRAVVIEIQHACNRIDTQSVKVKLF